MNNFLTSHAEATPDGVNIMYRGNDGMTGRVEVVSCINAINRLNTRSYGDKPDESMSMHLATADGGNQRYFDYASQHDIITWRWLVAMVFIPEMREESGTVNIIDDASNPSEMAVYSDGIVAMPLYPVVERLTMINNIEGAMIEHFGTKSGTERAIIFYRAMMDMGQGTLTPFGRETLIKFHSSLVVGLDENGMLAEPVTH